VWFCSKVGFSISKILLSRIWYSREQRKRNSWPFKLDLLIGVMKAGIEYAPHEPNIIKRFVGAAIPVGLDPAEGIRKSVSIPGFGSNDPNVPGEWIIRTGMEEETSDRVILYLHGGAYCFGSCITYRQIAAVLGEHSRAQVVAIDYRLAPDHPFPAALHDATAAYKWLIEAKQFSPKKVLIAGDSAGGGLAVALLLYLKEIGLPLPAGACAISGWFDLSCIGPRWEAARSIDYLPAGAVELLKRCAIGYAGTESNMKNPLVSPLYADLKGLPPLLLQVGDEERLYDDVNKFYDKAREAGVDATLEVYPLQVHVFQNFLFIPEAKMALRRIGAFAQRVLASHLSDPKAGLPPILLSKL